MQEKEIACNSPIEWVKQIMQAAREGWNIDEENVQRCPQFTGNMFFAVLVKTEGGTEVPDVSNETKEAVIEQPAQQTKRIPPRRKAAE